MRSTLWTIVGAAAIACGTGPGAIAADNAADAAAATGELETIIVTAQKTSEDASKIPIALSVFSGEELQRDGVVNVSELQNITPALSVGSAAHGPAIAIRGVATTDVTSKGDQGVVFNVDGVPVGRPEEMAIAFFDVSRIEVLRGPQGTLYGKSATGGVINVITNKPQDQFDASTSLEFGNFNTRRGEGMVNLPIFDGLAIRFAGTFNKRDGFLNPTLGNTFAVNGEAPRNDEDNLTGRVQALWNINSAGSVLLTGTFGHIGGTGDTTEALYNSYLHLSGSAERNVYYNPMAGTNNDHFENFSGEVNWDFGSWVHLTYIGAHQYFSANDNYDASSNDPASSGYYSWQNYLSQITTNSHELRLSNPKPQRIDWVVGANYYKEFNEEQDQNWNTQVAPGGTCPLYAPNFSALCNVPNPGITGPTNHESKGVFGQGSFHVTDDLKLTLGVRHSSDSLYRIATIAAGPGPFFDASGNPCAPPNNCVGGGPGSIAPDTGNESSSKVTWRVGVDYQLTTDKMVYATVSTGYKAGGFNDYNPASHGTAPYGPEELTAYEFGFKGKLLPSLQFNTDFYYYDYSRYDLTGATFLTPNLTGGPPNVVIYTTLVPATLYGWENELNWSPTKSDIFNASVAFAKGHFDGGPGHAVVGFIFSNQIDWSHKSLDNTPAVSGTVSYEHRWFMADHGMFSARIRSKLSSSYYESDLTGAGNPFAGVYSLLPQQYTQKSYSRTDLNVGYLTPSGKFDVGAYVRNVEDKLQMASGIENLGTPYTNAARVRVTDPRTFGIRFGLKF